MTAEEKTAKMADLLRAAESRLRQAEAHCARHDSTSAKVTIGWAQQAIDDIRKLTGLAA